MINPVFLTTFLALTESRSFTKAAARLHMTQPGVSQHLKWLEDHFGVALILRQGKTFEMTDAGHSLAAYCRNLFLEHERFKVTIRHDDPHEGLCRFSSPGSIGIKMYSFLIALNKTHPRLAIHYVYAPNSTTIRDVIEDRIDVGFVTVKPDDPSIKAEVLEEEELKLIVPSKFSMTDFASLRTLGFINHPDGFHHASRLLAENFPSEFTGMNEFPIRGFINQITRIPEPVGLGLGFTIL